MYHPGIFLLLASILGFAFACKKISKTSWNISLPFGLSLIMSILYIAALSDILQTAVYFIYTSGCALFLFFIIQGYLEHKSLEAIVQKEIQALLLITLIYYLRISPSYYAYWDDISSWGVFIKDIYYHHGLARPGEEYSSIKYFFYYPKLMPVVHYFAMKTIPFTEGNNLFISGWVAILFSCVMLVANSFWRSILLIASVLVPVLLLTSTLRSIYVDGTVAIIGGCALSILIQIDGYKKFIFIIPLFFILPAIKEVGFWLAYSVICGYVVTRFIMRDFDKISLLLASVTSTIPYCSIKLWEQYLGKFPSAAISKNKLTFVEFFHKLVNVHNDENDLVILLSFLKGIWKFLYSGGALVIYVLVVISVYLVSVYNRERLKELITYYIAFFIFLIFYLLFRLSLYYTHFSFYEASRAASSARYFSTFAIPFAFIAVSYIKLVLENLGSVELKKLRRICIVLGGILFFTISYLLFKKPPIRLLGERITMKEEANNLANLDFKKNKILIGFDNINLFNCYQFYFELADGRDTRWLFDQCQQQAGVESKKDLDSSFFDSINSAAFNDLNRDGKDPSKYDILYLSNPNPRTLEALAEKLKLKIIPRVFYELCH